MDTYDSDQEDVYIETPLQGVQPEFMDIVTSIKNKLHRKIIIDQFDENDPKAQDMEILSQYLRVINSIYNILQIENVEKLPYSKQQPWNKLPEEVREDVVKLVNIYFQFLQENKSQGERAPYEYFIERSLHENPYRQLPPEEYGYTPKFSDE